MVYCGPPSKGCNICRDRKIRCDLREPGCGQCEKRQQKCPGYRNMTDLMFRDESSHVIKKAQKRRRRRAATTQTPESVPSPETGSSPAGLSSSSSSAALVLLPPATPSLPSTPTRTSLGLQPDTSASLIRRAHLSSSADDSGSATVSLVFQQPESVQQPLPRHAQQQATRTREKAAVPSSPNDDSSPSSPLVAQMYDLDSTCQERGTAFFFSRYVTVDENASHQRFDFLYDIWKPGSLAAEQQLDGVLASMAAVGLVGISQLTHSDEIIDSARKSYGTALCLTNAALRDPKEAVKDTTMLSILILGVFEMMAEPGLKTMKTWHDHINGAVELAKLRGTSQFRTRAGIRMFRMLCENVTISCMQRHVPMPPELVALQSELAAGTRVGQEPGWFGGIDLSTPIYKLLQARHDVRSADLSSNLDALLARLNDIEAAFDRTISSIPADCYYKVFKVTRAHKAVFRDVCHVYPSIAAASVWNWLRAGRILVLETVLSAIQRHFPDVGDSGELVPAPYLAAFRQAWVKIERINSVIAASVPQHFGLLNPVHPYFDSLKPVPTVVAPLSTTEIRETPTPPAQSPISSAGSVQTPSGHSDDRAEGGEEDSMHLDDGGPSLDNPTRGRSPEEEAERYMILAAATNAVVWPLFAVGVSSACSPALKAYVVARLTAIFDETGLKQARSVAAIVRNRERIKSPWLTLGQRLASR